MLSLRMLAISVAAICTLGTNAMVTDAGIIAAKEFFTDTEQQVDEATLNMGLLQTEFRLNKNGVESASPDPYGGVPGEHDDFDIDSDMVSLMQHGLKYNSGGGIPVDSVTKDNVIDNSLELAPHVEELLESEVEAAVSLLQLNVELTPEVDAPSQDYCDEECILADDQSEIAEDWNIQMLQTSVQLAASSMVWPDMPPTETVSIAKKFSDASEDELADAIEDAFSDEYGGVMLFQVDAEFDYQNDIADQALARVSLLQRTITLQNRANTPDDKDLDNFGDADSLDATAFLQEVVEVDSSGHMVRNEAVEEAAEEDSPLATSLLQSDVHVGGVSLADAQSREKRKKRMAVMAHDGYDYMADPLNGKTEDIMSDETAFLQESAIATSAEAPTADTRIAVFGHDGVKDMADLQEAKTEKAESLDVSLLQVSVAAHSEGGAEVVSFDGDVEKLQVISFIQSNMVLVRGESDEDLGDAEDEDLGDTEDEDLGDVESALPAFEDKEAGLSETEIGPNSLASSFGEMAEDVASAEDSSLPESEVLLEMAEEDDNTRGSSISREAGFLPESEVLLQMVEDEDE